MKVESISIQPVKRVIVKKCHVCGEIIESFEEVQRCSACKKSFLPSNYLDKEHARNSKEFELLFDSSSEIDERDLIKGLHVLW